MKFYIEVQFFHTLEQPIYMIIMNIEFNDLVPEQVTQIS